jgi:hypothetical protein
MYKILILSCVQKQIPNDEINLKVLNIAKIWDVAIKELAVD